MEYTQNLKLKKPQRGANADAVDINDLNFNADKLDEAITGQMVVNIPISGWVLESNGTEDYYVLEISITGMTDGFAGKEKTDYCRVYDNNGKLLIAESETAAEMWDLIIDILSFNGYIKLYASEIPTTAFSIILYGMNEVI